MNVVAWLIFGTMVLMGIALWQVYTTTMLTNLLEETHKKDCERIAVILDKYSTYKENKHDDTSTK